MPAKKTAMKPPLRRALERALLARDRAELAAAERLLGVLRVEARKKTTRKRVR